MVDIRRRQRAALPASVRAALNLINIATDSIFERNKLEDKLLRIYRDLKHSEKPYTHKELVEALKSKFLARHQRKKDTN